MYSISERDYVLDANAKEIERLTNALVTQTRDLDNERQRLRAALQEVRDELRDRIDGATESAGRDTWISSLIMICERGLRS